jgi:hypothetical protein
MSETDLARSWRGLMGAGAGGAAARGGEPLRPEANENDGRGPAATVLSARDLSCSDQLKPWSGRAEGEHKSEAVLDWFAVLACEAILPHV